jgi:hypothetical protein
MSELIRIKYKKEYKAWGNMKQRCSNKTRAQYKDYGGRGIRVCQRWLNSFENFFKDMGPAPSPKHSIDRIDVNGSYSMPNCRWATRIEQLLNSRRPYSYVYKGKTMSLGQIAAEHGMNYGSLASRIYREGMSLEEALSKPMKHKHNTIKFVNREKYEELLAQATAMADEMKFAMRFYKDCGDSAEPEHQLYKSFEKQLESWSKFLSERGSS